MMKSNVLRSDQSVEEEIYEGQELPHDVITMHILTRLPIKSVLRFKLVSKQWYSTVSSYRFGDAHFKFSSLINPSTPDNFLFIQKGDVFYLGKYNECGENNLFRLEDDFRKTVFGCGAVVKGNEFLPIGSCNGLVCLTSLFDFILWNPVTRRFKKFDSDPNNRLNKSTHSRVSWGFGYVSSIDDYKVVRIIELPLTLEVMVHVFSMKSNSWRRIDPREYDHVLSLRSSFKNAVIRSEQRYMFHTNRGVLCDERVNWIVAKAEVWGRRVVSFDLVNDTFETYHNVELASREVYRDNFICVMRGCLSTYGANIRGDASICMYKHPSEENPVKESIDLFRDLCLSSCTDLIDLSNDGKFLVQRDDSEIGVVDSNLNPKVYRRLMRFVGRGNMYFTRHVPSLVAPEIEDSPLQFNISSSR